MFTPEKIPEIEAALAANGVSVAQFCREAEIAETTWGRWKNDQFMPSYRAAVRVQAAIKRMIGAPAGAK